MANPGDKVKVVKKKGAEEGIFIKEDKNSVFIKLGSGYNVGIDKKNISKIDVIEKGKGLSIKHAKDIKPKKGLPKISILHTGGTIASKVDYRTGAVVASFKPEDLIGMFPELLDLANINSRLIGNIFSEDMRFVHYGNIAKVIEEEAKKGCEGIILTHGTDTLSVTAAALSFILQEIPIPVIIVGAQRSSDRGSSDAAMNLVCAVEFMTKTDFAGVAICMHDYTSDEVCAILPATKTRKMHASRRDAFKAINDKPIARVNYKTRKIELIKKILYKKDKKRKIVVKPKLEDKVGLLKIHPNLYPAQVSFFKGYKGLILEGTGLGHAPITPIEEAEINKKTFQALKEVVASGCVVVMTTQTLFGRVNMNVYAPGKDLQDIGIIPGEDMLPETALVKLSWLLANNPKEVKDLIRENIKGEINERIEPDEFLE